MAEVLRGENITKSFPGVLAVDRLSLILERGEILALVGENGAGKSTLMHILGGSLRPEEGRILLEGQAVSFNSPEDAIDAGISVVPQELSLVGSLSVAENIFANRQPVGPLKMIDWRALYADTEAFLRRFELAIDPRRLVKHLSMGQQQILEILKAISTKPRVLILDEPTSSLTEGESAYLFESIRKLQKQGMSFIYVTHKLFEVFSIASRVIVLRDGKLVGSKKVDEVSEDELVAMMVGRPISHLYGDRTERVLGEAYFKIEGLGRKRRFAGISFELHRGEILGMAGLVGARRTEIGRSIFGADPVDTGHITLNGEELTLARPREAIRKGIVYLTEDRKAQGLFLTMSVEDNLVAPNLSGFTTRLGALLKRKMATYAGRVVSEYSIDTPSISKKVVHLSGGNQQKVLVATWMGIRPEVIIFDEPTRGVDVGARAEIYQKILQAAAEGAGVVLISSDMAELIGMCDRILVIHEGRITWEAGRENFNEEKILAHAAGLANGSAGGSPQAG
ncbi:MAG: putative fucose ABC transporter, ATP-binding component [candidate division NC10 bacterium]|nr:putative fucose ABC transporter, ATP-binding component [candidate division NC10 bacterium]